MCWTARFLVLSAVEGVQPQTRILLRALQRRGIPTVLFVNKVDRRGADVVAVQDEIERRLRVPTLAMGRVERAGTREAEVTAYRPDDPPFRDALVELLTAHDDQLLRAYVEDEIGSGARVWRDELVRQTRRCSVYPLFAGSALTGAGHSRAHGRNRRTGTASER